MVKPVGVSSNCACYQSLLKNEEERKIFDMQKGPAKTGFTLDATPKCQLSKLENGDTVSAKTSTEQLIMKKYLV